MSPGPAARGCDGKNLPAPLENADPPLCRVHTLREPARNLARCGVEREGLHRAEGVRVRKTTNEQEAHAVVRKQLSSIFGFSQRTR